jgi:hypothetical protein
MTDNMIYTSHTPAYVGNSAAVFEKNRSEYLEWVKFHLLNLAKKIELILSKDLSDDSGLFEACFSQAEFPESGGKMSFDFQGKFKKW